MVLSLFRYKVISYKLVFLISFVLCGCASKFKPIATSSLLYDKSYIIRDTLRVSYKDNIQLVSGNKRYARKERKRNRYATAVKIENISSKSITLTRDNFRVNMQNNLLHIYTPEEYAKRIKQRVGLHLLHCLWGPWSLSWQEQDGKTEFHFIYIPIGTVVGIGNAIRASNANKANLAMMQQNEIWNRNIAAGSTLYGIIALKELGDSLKFSYNPSGFTKYVSVGNYVEPNKPVSNSYEFYVLPKEGSPFTLKAHIDISSAQHFISANQRGTVKIIKPSDTQSLSRVTSEGKQLLGMPVENSWRFKVIEGAINGYYFLAEDNPEFVNEIQKGNGPIVPFSPETLLQMIGGDPEIGKLVNRQKYIRAIKAFNRKY